jgi:hypothetical protein
VLEEYLMKERIYTIDGASQQSGAEPARRVKKKALEAPKNHPTPCAICFEYPACSVAPPLPQEGVGEPSSAFIAKSAGEQYIGCAVFQAAFLYTEQCRRVGFCATPIPRTHFSCFLTDAPSLCFLREVRLRCADAGWTTRLACPPRRLRLAGWDLDPQIDCAVDRDLCAFVAECYQKLDFHPPPTSVPCLFYGFVRDAGTQVIPSSDAAPSTMVALLPASGSAEVRAVLKEKVERDVVRRQSNLGGGGGGSSNTSSTGGNAGTGDGKADLPLTVRRGAQVRRLSCTASWAPAS